MSEACLLNNASEPDELTSASSGCASSSSPVKQTGQLHRALRCCSELAISIRHHGAEDPYVHAANAGRLHRGQHPRRCLAENRQLDNTIILFFFDHSCAFRTRLGEYKRSPHEFSIRVPFVIAGPDFDKSATIREVVSLLGLTPTLLDGAGIRPIASMRGKSLKTLVDDPKVRREWDSTAYFQISQSICGRGIRTSDWCYCAFNPAVQHGEAEYSKHYQDFALYSIAGDPTELLNLRRCVK